MLVVPFIWHCLPSMSTPFILIQCLQLSSLTQLDLLSLRQPFGLVSESEPVNAAADQETKEQAISPPLVLCGFFAYS